MGTLNMNETHAGWKWKPVAAGDRVLVHGQGFRRLIATVKTLAKHSSELEIISAPKACPWRPGNRVGPVAIWWLEAIK